MKRIILFLFFISYICSGSLFAQKGSEQNLSASAENGTKTQVATPSKLKALTGSTSICVKKEGSYDYQINDDPGGPDEIHHLMWDFGDGTVPTPENNVAQPVSTKTYTYQQAGSYTITVTPYRDAAGLSPIDSEVQTMEVKVSSCKLPVNHNVSAMEY
jgi:hypothetical protein